MRLLSIPAACSLAYALSAAPALAQAPTDNATVGEIVVTAQKRSENLQRTPIAITAMTAETLRRAGVTSLAGVAQNTPTLTISAYPTSPSTLVTYIRGQGVGDPMQITRDGSVSVYIDGVYQARPQAMAFDLADATRVEILRGPQGTLYGRNTTGGAVNIITEKPTNQFGGYATLDAGNYGYHRALADVKVPLTSDLAAKLTLLESHMDGWVKNSGKDAGTPEANNYNLRDQLGARLALRWTPRADVTVDYAGDVGESKSTPTYYASSALVGLIPGYRSDPGRTYRPVYLPESDSKTHGHALTVAWEVSPDLTLRSLTGFRHLNYFSYQDYAETFFVPFVSSDKIFSDSFSQEFQAVGKVADPHIEYAAGLYYFRESAKHHSTYDINPTPAYLGGADNTLVLKDRQVDAISTSYAIYGQLTWRPAILDERLGLTVGGRYTWDRRHAERLADLGIFTAAPGQQISPLVNRTFLPAGSVFDTGAAFQAASRNWQRFNPAATIDFQATRDVNLYVKYATAYKAGGFTESAPDFTQNFSPESVKNYEVGVKADLFERRARVNVAAFIEKFKGLQIDFETDPNDLSLVEIINAGSATVKGIEAELTVRPVRPLTVNLAYTYLSQDLSVRAPPGTIFDPAVNPGAPTAVGGDVSGYLRIPFTPKHNFNVNANWTMAEFERGDLTLYAAYTYRGEMFASAGSGPLVPNNRLYARPSYDTVDLRLTYSLTLHHGEELTVAAWGKNILDKRHADDFVIANGSILTGYLNQATPYAMPATWGMQVGLRF